MSRIDPNTERVTARIEVPKVHQANGPGTKIADGAGGIWMVTAGEDLVFDVLIRIDPRTEQVEDRIELGHIGGAVAVSDHAVWVAVPDDDVVLKVDPRAGRVVDKIEDLAAPNLIAVGEDGVWVLSGVRTDQSTGDGSVTRLDPVTGEVIERIQVDDQAGQAGDIAIGEGLVWVRTQFTLLAGIDPETNRLVDRIIEQKGLGGVTSGSGSVWLSDFSLNRVWRIRLPS